MATTCWAYVLQNILISAARCDLQGAAGDLLSAHVGEVGAGHGRKPGQQRGYGRRPAANKNTCGLKRGTCWDASRLFPWYNLDQGLV